MAVYGPRNELTAYGGYCGWLQLIRHLVGASRVLNGIASGWDQESQVGACFASNDDGHICEFLCN